MPVGKPNSNISSNVLSRGSFWKIQKFLNFPIANYSPKMSKIPGRKSNGTEISGKKFSKILVFLASLPASFAEILENAVPFATENFWNLGLEFYVKWELSTSIQEEFEFLWLTW